MLLTIRTLTPLVKWHVTDSLQDLPPTLWSTYVNQVRLLFLILPESIVSSMLWIEVILCGMSKVSGSLGTILGHRTEE